MAGTIPTPATIQQGAKSQTVKNAQGLLTAHGNSPGAIDGDFGPKTKTATQAFQTANHLTVDGIIGQNSWTALVGS